MLTQANRDTKLWVCRPFQLRKLQALFHLLEPVPWYKYRKISLIKDFGEYLILEVTSLFAYIPTYQA
jgi:hypothetical protein